MTIKDALHLEYTDSVTIEDDINCSIAIHLDRGERDTISLDGYVNTTTTDELLTALIIVDPHLLSRANLTKVFKRMGDLPLRYFQEMPEHLQDEVERYTVLTPDGEVGLGHTLDSTSEDSILIGWEPDTEVDSEDDNTDLLDQLDNLTSQINALRAQIAPQD